MLSLTEQVEHQFILFLFQFFHVLILPLSHLLESLIGISKRSLQFLSTLTTLTGMSLIHHDGILVAPMFLYLFIDLREALERSDDDTRLIRIDDITQFLTSMSIILRDRRHRALHMFKAKDCLLQLAIQHTAVGYHEHSLKDVSVLLVMER